MNIKDMVSIDEFASQKKLRFKSDKAKISWFQRLKADSLVPLGATYFINKTEAEQLMQEELLRRINTKKKRIKQARINFKLDKKRKLFAKREEVTK